MAEGYLDRVVESYQGEVYGEALFRELSVRSDDADERYKWRVLQQLEAETKTRLRPLVSALGGNVNEDPAGTTKGIRLAEQWSNKTWSERMESLAAMLPTYVRFFEKLEADARAEDREILGHVTAHERALEEFARRECANQGDTSLEPVVALLRDVPER